MGNDIGCQVCSSQEVALYELDMTNSSKVKPQKLTLDKEIVISKLRKLQIFSLNTMYITILPILVAQCMIHSSLINSHLTRPRRENISACN